MRLIRPGRRHCWRCLIAGRPSAAQHSLAWVSLAGLFRIRLGYDGERPDPGDRTVVRHNCLFTDLVAVTRDLQIPRHASTVPRTAI